MKKLATLFSVLLLYTSIGMAQKRPTLSFGLEVGEPIGEFDHNYNGNPVGLGLSLSIPSRNIPIYWGLDFGYGSMGSNAYDVHIEDQNLAVDEGRIKIRSNIYSYHATSRIRPFNGQFSPYVEGLAGFRTFSTKTKIDVDGLDEPYSTQKNTHDVVFSYGLAGGFMLGLGKNVFMEARVERLWGGEVDYVLQNSVEIDENDNLSYEVGRSRTEIVNIHLGLGLKF